MTECVANSGLRLVRWLGARFHTLVLTLLWDVLPFFFGPPFINLFNLIPRLDDKVSPLYHSINYVSKRMNKIGSKLRILRNKQGLSTRELGKILNISSTYIVRIENGQRRPSIDVVANIARFFNFFADQLIMDELELED